jgi:hypothetical protein
MTPSYQNRHIGCSDIVTAAQRRAETMLIGAMILIIAIALEPQMNRLNRAIEKLPMLSHGLRSVLIS